MEYGPKYDTAVQELMQELIARLEQWMSVPDMDQVNLKVLQYSHRYSIALLFK